MVEAATNIREEVIPVVSRNPNIKIIPLAEIIARKYAFEHRHESYQDVAFVIGITPRGLQHKYEMWSFSPKTPCRGYVTAVQYSRFYKIPYPTVVERITHRNLEARKHGLIWEIPLSPVDRKKLLENERKYEGQRRKRDKRFKDKRFTPPWSEEAKQILLSYFPTETPAEIRKRLLIVGEDRSERAIGTKYYSMTFAERNRRKVFPRNHGKKYTEKDEWEILLRAVNEPTDQIAKRLGRKSRAIRDQYKELGIDFFHHDQRISLSELARHTGIPVSTLRTQLSLGKLTQLEVVKVGRHIRVSWKGTMEEVRPEWDGRKIKGSNLSVTMTK